MYNNLCNETARYILLNYFREFEYLCTHIYIYIFAVKNKRKVSKGLAVYSTIEENLSNAYYPKINRWIGIGFDSKSRYVETLENIAESYNACIDRSTPLTVGFTGKSH